MALSSECASFANDRGRFRYHDPLTNQTMNMKPLLLMSLCLFPLAAAVSSCREKGPVEKAGENVDEAVENVKDAVNPKGPVEKAGEKVDKALGN